MIDKRILPNSEVNVNTVPALGDFDLDGRTELLYRPRRGQFELIHKLEGNTIDTITLPSNIHFNTSKFPYPLSTSGFKKKDTCDVIFISTRKTQDGRYITAFNKEGEIVWNTPKEDDELSSHMIIDLNKDGIEELVMGNNIYNAQTGQLLLSGKGNGKGPENSSIAVGELNGDPSSLEIAAGYTIYEVDIQNPYGTTGNTITPINLSIDGKNYDGHTRIADINDDKKLDVVVVSRKNNRPFMYAYTMSTGSSILLDSISLTSTDNHEHASSSYGILGTDKTTGFVINVMDSIVVYTYENGFTHIASYPLPSISPANGVTLFDIDGDGGKEILYNSEKHFGILGLRKAKIVPIHEKECENASFNSYPLVGDLDNDGETEICVPCRNDRRTFNLTIFSSPEDGPAWAPARSIWHQHNYEILGINDDMTIPQYMENKATYKNGRYNTFGAQATLLDENGMYDAPAASLYGDIDCITYDAQRGQYDIAYTIYNKEDASRASSDSLYIAFYDGDPASGGSLLSTERHTTILNPKDSLQATHSVATSSDRLFMVINHRVPTGTTLTDADFIDLECDYTDNIVQATLPQVEESSEELCKGETYTYYGQDLTTSGSYTHRLKDTRGCDSLVQVLHLTVRSCGEEDCIDPSVDKCYAKTKFRCDSIEVKEEILTNSQIDFDQVPTLGDFDFDGHPDLMYRTYFNKHDFIHLLKDHSFETIPFSKEPFNYPYPVSTSYFKKKDTCSITFINIQKTRFNVFISAFDRHGTEIWNTPKNDHPERNITISDLNKDGIEEAIVGNRIYNAQTGDLLLDGKGNGRGIDNVSISLGELNGDPSSLEIAAGHTVYEVDIQNPYGETGNTITPINLSINGRYYDGHTRIADINGDQELDVVVVSRKNNRPFMYAYTMSTGSSMLLDSVSLIKGVRNEKASCSYGILGTDKTPGFVINVMDSIVVYTYKDGFSLAASYILPSISAANGVTLFDIDGDGGKEILYNSDKHFGILSLREGKLVPIHERECVGSGFHSYPLVGDLDNDGEAEICVPCRNDRREYNLTIFSSPEDGPAWAPARSIWHQHNYEILGINDDMTIPQYMENKATYMNGRYNTFGAQATLLDENGMYDAPAASLYGAIDCITYDAQRGQYDIAYTIYNKEDASRASSDSLYIAFYDGDPSSGGSLLSTERHTTILNPKDSLQATHSVAASSDRLFMVINHRVPTGTPLTDADFIDLECDFSDNIVQATLPKVVAEAAEVCKNTPYDFYGQSLTTSGIYTHIVSDQKGCDSLLYQLDLTVSDTVAVSIEHSACNSYTWNGTTHSTSGTYIERDVTAAGCDSITTLLLTIHEAHTQSIQNTACDSLRWQGTTYTESGAYSFVGKTIHGCDSTVVLSLDVHPSYASTESHAACDTYTWNGATYTDAGVYTYFGKTAEGCDSIVTLDLTISDQIETTESIEHCASYDWNGTTYTESGTYSVVGQSVHGCDSTAILVLTIFSEETTAVERSTCDSLRWNGELYTTSGIYSYDTQSIQGCDSTVVLSLDVHPSYAITESHAACDTYTWQGTTYTDSGVYTYSGKTAEGCDSIVTLDLTISDTLETEVKHTACGTYRWQGTELTTSGAYSHTAMSTAGCDSIVTLDLTLFPSYKNHVELESCTPYTWDQTKDTYGASGRYMKAYTSVHGCDSVYVLDLQIHPSYTFRDTVETTGSYAWPITGQAYTESGAYTATYETIHSCDSLYYLYLHVKEHTDRTNPNIFRPNGENAYFNLSHRRDIERFLDLRIYDRWGSLIYQEQDAMHQDKTSGWDGKKDGYPVTGGVYMWLAEIQYTDGSRGRERGDVTVVR